MSDYTQASTKVILDFVCFTLMPFNRSRARSPPCFCLCLISFKSTHSSPDSKSSTIINYSRLLHQITPPADTAHFPGPGRGEKKGGRSKRGRNGARKTERNVGSLKDRERRIEREGTEEGSGGEGGRGKYSVGVKKRKTA